MGCCWFSVDKCQRKNTHSDQVTTMDSFETFSYDCLHSQQIGSFGCPVSARSWSILFASKNDSLNLAIDVPLRCIKNIQSLSSWDVDSLRTNCTLHHLIDNSNICKGSSGHDEVIASPCTISIEISFFDPSLLQKSGSRRWDWDVARRWDMVSCDRISKNC